MACFCQGSRKTEDKKLHLLENNESIKNEFNIIVVGESGVGKSQIISRIWGDEFNPNSRATIGIDFKMINIHVKNKNIKFKVWDTAGQERYKSLASSFFRNVQGIILVYDVSNKESFEDLKIWLDSIKSNLGSSENNVKKIIIGNKIDLDREVTKDEAETFCKQLKIEYFETSAKENVNVKEAFLKLVHMMLGSKLDTQKLSVIRLSDRPSDVSSEESKKCKC